MLVIGVDLLILELLLLNNEYRFGDLFALFCYFVTHFCLTLVHAVTTRSACLRRAAR